MATLDMDKVRQNRKKKMERIWDQGKDGKFSWNDMIRRDIDQVAAEAEKAGMSSLLEWRNGDMR